MKKLITLITLLFLFLNTAYSQSYKNNLSSHYSYAFLGSGDSNTSSIGISYTHFISKKFGIHGNINKTTATSTYLFDDVEKYNYTGQITSNVKEFMTNYNIYHSINLGLSYRVTDGQRNVLTASVGVNGKDIKTSAPSLTITGSATGIYSVTMDRMEYKELQELGLYIALDYTYFINDNFGLGIRGSIEASNNIMSTVGVSANVRFGTSNNEAIYLP